VFLQKQEERETDPVLSKSTSAVMTCRAIVRKQFGGRFSLIEILSVRRAADQHGNCASREDSAPEFPQRHPFR
jgi:hypothetical protein